MTKKLRSVTPAQIAAWKKEYGDHKIYEIPVKIPLPREEGKEQEFEEIIGVARKPGLDEILAAEEYAPDDSVKQNLFLFQNCYLGGDPLINSEDELKLAVANEIASLFKFYKASSKKL
ncbi:MAG: hypothetical protein J0G96_07165 [Flavobacteriia bacterium]|nr:hypothetical protein [Flavobacteriia bacterium]OJX36648.1 MAG: hypothetical protein BGO87_12675 [Flavobacteriia bacterium 40-80]